MAGRLVLLWCGVVVCLGGILNAEAKTVPEAPKDAIRPSGRHSEEDDNLPPPPALVNPRRPIAASRAAANHEPEEEDGVKQPLKPQPRSSRTSPPIGKGGKKATRQRWDVDFDEVWGYIDVRPGAHMFYWLYTSTHPDGPANRPLILWLQGGPGASSCGYGNFEIIGPLDLDLQPRNTTWVQEANILFVDNPVGSGYSYVDSLDLLTTDVQQITNDLTVVLTEVLGYFPEFQTTPLYVFGQSYGGKMGSHFATHIYNEAQAGRMTVNVAGFAMGNSWISPIDSTMTWGPLLYQMSLVDQEGHDAIQAEAQLAQDAIDAGNWTLATDYWASTEWVVIQETHGVDFYNILKFEDYWGRKAPAKLREELRYGLARYSRNGAHRLYRSSLSAKAGDPLDDLMNGPIREKLGIIPENVTWGGQSGAVFDYQAGDFMKPVVSVVDDALINTNMQVIVYQGQLDLICDTAGAMDWVQQLKWDRLNEYNGATRKWFIDDAKQVELYVKALERFKFYWVLGAGHAVPKDNGWTALRMLQRILGNQDT